MTIVPEMFDSPDDIMTKILTGEFTRIGGVIRHAVGPRKGQIVKHLIPIDMKVAEQGQGIGAKTLQFAKNNKKGFVVVSICIAVAAFGTEIYHRIKMRELEVVSKFRSTLKDYISAIRTGNLDMKVIDNLMSSLDELKKHKDYEKINIQLSTEELDILVNKIYEYTVKLAKENSVELTDEAHYVSEESGDAIINLQKYLNTQKRIFEMAV